MDIFRVFIGWLPAKNAELFEDTNGDTYHFVKPWQVTVLADCHGCWAQVPTLRCKKWGLVVVCGSSDTENSVF